MLKLFFAPGACCMSCHIALEETKMPFELAEIGWEPNDAGKKELLKYNPLGAVPTLLMDDGKVLTQNIAILEYIADQKPEAGLLGKPGSWERADTLRWLSFVASDLHKAFSPLFGLENISSKKDTQADIKNWCFANIDKYLMLVEKHLQTKDYLAAERFTVADAYLFTVLGWSKAINFPMDKYTAIARYQQRIAKRPSVLAVFDREGLSA